MAKISLKKDYMDGNVLYGKDLNPNFETIETTINSNDDAQSKTNASVNEAITQLSSDMSQAKTDIGELQKDVTNLESGITGGDSTTLESAKAYTDTKLQDYAKTTDIPTKISELENDDNTVKDADYVHTDNNFSDTDKSKLDSLNNYELPIASASILGGIKLGEGLTSEADGTVNVTGGGGSGENGATFTPDVSDAGTLSWTNDKGLPNPDPVNIKGPKGDTGDTGPQGEPGTIGPQGETGLQGAAGEDYLGYYSSINYTQVPSIGSTVTFQLEHFSRTPVVGDNFVVVAKQANRSYLINYKVNSVDVGDGECIAAVSAFVETTGIQGPAGPAGQDGADGADGQGVPTGGTTGQVLAKNSDTAFDTIWKTVESGGIPRIYYLKASSSSPINLFDEEYCKYGIYICDSEDPSFSAYSNSLSQATGYASFYPFIRILLPFNQNDTETNRTYIRAIELKSDKLAVGTFSVVNPRYTEKEAYSLSLKETFHQTGGIASSNLTNTLAEAIDGKGSGFNIALSTLQTTDKTSLIAAINELNTRLAALENPTE